jgi:hypothetical protein
MAPHPVPDEQWGKDLTTPEFVTNQTGRMGVNIYTGADPDQVCRRNAHDGQHNYYPAIEYGE